MAPHDADYDVVLHTIRSCILSNIKPNIIIILRQTCATGMPCRPDQPSPLLPAMFLRGHSVVASATLSVLPAKGHQEIWFYAYSGERPDALSPRG
jgi:hypothetical protein